MVQALSAPAVEESIYDATAMRRFMGIDLGREAAPDESTVLRFRHRLEKHHLGKKLFGQVHRYLEAQGLTVAHGTFVDATFIAAPSSTKNKDQKRDPDMRQTQKGNQWHFDMKAHIGDDSKSKIIHAVVASAANAADSQVLPDLLHGEETKVWGDRAYPGPTEVIKQCAPKARNMIRRRCRNRGQVDSVERAKNRNKSKVRAKVEHAFGIIKNIFGFVKVRYKGLAKNANRLFVTCALANLYRARYHLFGLQGGRCVQ